MYLHTCTMYYFAIFKISTLCINSAGDKYLLFFCLLIAIAQPHLHEDMLFAKKVELNYL